MTKADVIKMLENVADNEEVIFIENKYDYDGLPCNKANPNIYRIVKATTPLKKVMEYGVYIDRFI